MLWSIDWTTLVSLRVPASGTHTWDRIPFRATSLNFINQTVLDYHHEPFSFVSIISILQIGKELFSYAIV